MNVTRKILYSFGIAAVLTALAINFFPDVKFTDHVVKMLIGGFLATIALATISFYREGDMTMHDKNILMSGLLVAVLLPSLYAAGAFVHESQTSWSGGEIHWHADFEVFTEENGELERLNLIDPENFCEETTHESSYMCSVNDRVGSTEYHEHNDNRIHVEGTFKNREDATLTAFFEEFEGQLENDKMVFPTNDGEVEIEEDFDKSLKILVRRGVSRDRHWCLIGKKVPQDDICRSYDGELAKTPADYVVSPYTRGPNLDDIFIVYDSQNPQEALEDVREDNLYRGEGLQKSGEGYGG